MQNDRDCADTHYCHWNTTSSGCEDPDNDFISVYTPWNPGCYIFDNNQTQCENVVGCSFSGGTCNSNATIAADGLSCNYVNDSSLCNSIASLDTCCAWQGTSCTADRFSSACYDQIEEPPTGATYCEDYNSYNDKTLCDQISVDPWFMPCQWNNATKHCEVKKDKIFTEGKESLVYLDNKQSCEFAGGKWVTESYCSGSIAVSSGRCEFKFDDERNCNKACYACDYQNDGTNWTTAEKAKGGCIASKLGICEFTTDTTAPNGYGTCDVDDDIENFGDKTCASDCGVCTFMGNPTAANAENRPSTYCKNSDANCKWIPDLTAATDESKGRCASTAEKTCEDRCDKCQTQQNCKTYGAKKGNESLDNQCSWNTNTNLCDPKSGGDQLEVCFDGIDNNNNGKIDCADAMCYSDPFCGGGTFGSGQDCFSYSENATCTAGNCTWVEEQWGSWCDIPGAACWKLDGDIAACNSDANCEFHEEFNGGFCEEDWTAESFNSCFNAADENSCSSAGGNCTWTVDNWCNDVGGWCEFDSTNSGDWVNCNSLYTTEATCNDASSCQWRQDTWCESQGASAGWCDHVKFTCWQYDQNQSACTGAVLVNGTTNMSDWCQFESSDWGNWCSQKTSGGNSCWDQNDQSSCTSAGCNWKSGFCDPVGFGGSVSGGAGADFAGSGMSCFKFNANESYCSEQNGCGWFDESRPFCDVDFSDDCPQFSYNQTLCDAASTCSYNPNGNFCDYSAFECHWNFTLQTNLSACDANSLCYNNSGFCEPLTRNATTESECTSYSSTLYRWVDGFCEGAMAASFFKEMEGGAPIPLGFDPEGDAPSGETDIIDFGMKDMGNAFGFGMRLANLENASMCNDIRLQSGSSGTGQNTSKYYWYIDTDGVRDNNCATKHNASLTGYEFYFAYEASFSTSSNKVSEKQTAFKCGSNGFTATDIKVSGSRQKMCGEIGGAMVAIEKNDLEKHPDLYTTGADIRVLVTTANAITNVSTPVDTAASGFMTPGAIDFDLDKFDFMKLSNKSSGGVDKASKGYIHYDADCWTSAGCGDYSCYNHPYCTANSLGVHASGFEDSRTPKMIGIARELYPDSALITYYTDKPANGTMEFYGTDSTCTTLNDTIYDVGVTSNASREYKLWHSAEIYNDGDEYSLAYDLLNDTKYYFKLKICDDAGKCGSSKCSDFLTEGQNKCAFCDFVTRIQAPSGWNVSYDRDQDGVYEHEQGLVCGANAGMATNYTNGRRANVKLTKSDNSSWMEFLNARLTKSGLSSKVRDIKASSSLVQGTTSGTSIATVGYTGMATSTRDKIINNLYPEICMIKIPGSGTCTELWHCDDTDLSKCVNRTAEATLNQTGTDYCIWEIPYCEFSVWSGGEPDTSSSSSSSSSSGGGGGGSSAAGGGGGGGAASSSSTAKVWAKITRVFALVSNGESITVPVVHENISVSEVSMVIGETSKVVSVSVASLQGQPTTTLPAPGKAFEYLEIIVSNANKVSNRKISFSVPTKWLSENNVNPEEIILFRWETDWNPLPTLLTSQTSDKVTYETTTPGFSFFVIGTEKEDIPEEIVLENPEEQEPTVQQIQDDILKKESPSYALFFFLGIILVIALVWYIFHGKPPKKESKPDFRPRKARK